MKRTMRVATSAVVGAAVLAMGLASPVAGSSPRTVDNDGVFRAADFFPMTVGNAWQWADAKRKGDEKHLRIVDSMNVKGYTVWVAESVEIVDGERQIPSNLYFVDHERGLFATKFMDTLLDWSHDTDQTAMLQRWTQRDVVLGTHEFNSGAAAKAYTLAVESGALTMSIHSASGGTTYQRYAQGIGPVERGTFQLQRATIGGSDYVF